MADQDGVVVKKGQTIFKIEPDEKVEPESEESIAARIQETTSALVG